MTNALYARIEAIESFAADVSHELKNPLTSLRSAVETLPIAKSETSRERLMEIIQHDVRRLDRLITDISDASRLDAELAREDAAKVDLKKFVGDLVAVTLDTGGRVERARVATISMSPTPVVLDLTDAVVGRVWDAADWTAAARQAAGALDPDPDVHATAAYRLSLAEVLVRQALDAAAQGARAATDAPLTTAGGGNP